MHILFIIILFSTFFFFNQKPPVFASNSKAKSHGITYCIIVIRGATSQMCALGHCFPNPVGILCCPLNLLVCALIQHFPNLVGTLVPPLGSQCLLQAAHPTMSPFSQGVPVLHALCWGLLFHSYDPASDTNCCQLACPATICRGKFSGKAKQESTEV